MAIAVLDLDIDRLPPALNLAAKYERALVLLRVAGRPAGQALISLGTDDPDDLQKRLLRAADSAFWEAWLRDRLRVAVPQDPPPPSLTTTVAVCTRDRTEDLERCIAALLAMPDDGQEIIIVDNAPATQGTRELVARFPRLRYVLEERPGLDVARNRALREARTDIVAFTDDDAAPDPLWLRALAGNFADPLVLAATGSTMPMELESDAQIAFQSYGGFLRGFKRIVYDPFSQSPLLGWHAGAGVNMALRRSVVDLVGSFDEALDAGTATQAGGDSDMFRRILAAGYRIVYDPEALNWHRHRRSQAELTRQLYGYEVAGSAVLCKALLYERDLSSLTEFLRWLRRELGGFARAALRRPGAAPLPLAASRLRGGAAGPGAYITARRGRA
ncbi:glycosyltransferase family 2 protein [Rubellimicrobium roseum]|uniref:Glycosyltransferase n=1 Tax=Rubellimicrobium roseum TaxID=687525 RepID=A0A5C4NBH8_9RHOB|nr:glycosyltransferase [Rubellimicrobium roseum]TNC71392.1 glycosyltransferase [Rubellimicrobium roseum]